MKNIFCLLLLCCTIVLGVQQDPDPQCWLPGECEGNCIIAKVVESDIDCQRFCEAEHECNWITYLEQGKLCFLFSECVTIDETTTGCVSSERRCFETTTTVTTPTTTTTVTTSTPITTVTTSTTTTTVTKPTTTTTVTTSTPITTVTTPTTTTTVTTQTTTTTVTTSTPITTLTTSTPITTVTTSTTLTPETTSSVTTSSPFPVYSKVLVGLGCCGTTADVEVIDLLSSETTCQKPKNFPFKNYYATGRLGIQEKPLICGGFNNDRSACYLYEDGTWKSSSVLKQARYGFAMTSFQDDGSSSKLFITGGFDKSSQNSTEVLTENGWQLSVPLPLAIHYHCMVTYNSTTAMVIGGYQSDEISGKSFLFNSAVNIWTDGPTLNTSRSYQSCGLIKESSQTQEKVVIVAGGWDGFSYLSSVEVLSSESNEWRGGPNLPIGLYGAVMVEDPSGGVVVIGGFSDNKNLDTLYRLPHAGSDATWELMTQKLTTKRYHHTAFLIPDDVAACN